MRKLRITSVQMTQLLNGRVSIKLHEQEFVADVVQDRDDFVAVVVTSKLDENAYFRQKESASRHSHVASPFDELFSGLFGR